MNKVWSNEEKEYILQNAATLTDKEGAEKLTQLMGRTVTLAAWRKQRQKLGIKKSPGRSVCKIADVYLDGSQNRAITTKIED